MLHLVKKEFFEIIMIVVIPIKNQKIKKIQGPTDVGPWKIVALIILDCKRIFFRQCHWHI
jgi:hypothetical protein